MKTRILAVGIITAVMMLAGCAEFVNGILNPPPKPPVVEPTTPPTPTPTPGPVVTPTPGPTPEAKCPVRVPMNAREIWPKVTNPLSESGKAARADSTPRVMDRDYCRAVTGLTQEAFSSGCKANPEGSGLDVCDAEFLGDACPIWQYSLDGGTTWARCLPDRGPVTCDHFDHWQEWKRLPDGTEAPNPYTGKCQHYSGPQFPLNDPIAGFFTVFHGNALMRVCDATATVCGSIASYPDGHHGVIDADN